MKSVLNALRRVSLTMLLVLVAIFGGLQALGLLHERAVDPRRPCKG